MTTQRKRHQVCFSINPAILPVIDDMAKAGGVGRATVIRGAVETFVQKMVAENPSRYPNAEKFLKARGGGKR